MRASRSDAHAASYVGLRAHIHGIIWRKISVLIFCARVVAWQDVFCCLCWCYCAAYAPGEQRSRGYDWGGIGVDLSSHAFGSTAKVIGTIFVQARACLSVCVIEICMSAMHACDVRVCSCLRGVCYSACRRV